MTAEQGPRGSEWTLFPFGVRCDWTGFSGDVETSNATWLGSLQFIGGLLLVCGAVGVLAWAAFGG